MAIQVTSPIEYNYGTYQNLYFRLVPRLVVDGSSISVESFLYPSKQAFLDNAYYIASMHFNVPFNTSVSNSADGVVNKYLQYVTEQVILQLETMYPEATFEITEIPQEGTLTN